MRVSSDRMKAVTAVKFLLLTTALTAYQRRAYHLAGSTWPIFCGFRLPEDSIGFGAATLQKQYGQWAKRIWMSLPFLLSFKNSNNFFLKLLTLCLSCNLVTMAELLGHTPPKPIHTPYQSVGNIATQSWAKSWYFTGVFHVALGALRHWVGSDCPTMHGKSKARTAYRGIGLAQKLMQWYLSIYVKWKTWSNFEGQWACGLVFSDLGRQLILSSLQFIQNDIIFAN